MRDLSPKAQSLSKLFAYLGLVESLGVTLVDMALLLLIANGKEMHIRVGTGIRHVTNLRELRKLNLNYKLEFLQAYDLDYVAKLIDRNLRNDIAHLKFEIQKRGKTRGSNGRPINIDEVLRSFWSRVDTIISIFKEIKFLQFVEKGEGRHE